MPDARIYHRLPSPFAFKRGGALRDAVLAYETWGTLNTNASNAVLLLTGLSPNAHAASSGQNPDAGWWEYMVGPGKAIDTNRFFVICVNSLGSCKGSTGAASIDPDTQTPYRVRFPELTLEDIAASAADLVRALGIQKLAALVGASMGGMSVLAYLLQNPNGTRGIVNISAAPRSLPFALALRSLQREAIVSDPDWQDGNYPDDRWPKAGMRMARKIGVITYRSAQEWRYRFAREPLRGSQSKVHSFAGGFQIESYLEGHAQRFAAAFDPCCYVYLSRAMDWFDLTDYGGTIPALKSVRAERALVIGVKTDLLFPPDQQLEIAGGLRGAGIPTEFAELDSIQGHDAFLVDTERFAPRVARFFGLVEV
jgi:homoserine O-acetyltransferase/O-succinyltransferase